MCPTTGERESQTIARGAAIGRYIVLGELGRGGGGIVVEAFDPELDRRVALKLLSIEAGRERRELTREGRVLAKFVHPNIASVFDVGATTEWVYIAMELVAGGDLVNWLGARERGAVEILAVFREAGRGLVAAHAKGLLHRDFKPANILIGEDRVRVTDFGLAQIDPQTRGTLVPGDPLRGLVESQPSAGGTPGFIAPEVERGEQPTALADEFAFCVSLLWALTGEMRGEADALEATLARRGVPARARRAVLRGLADDPRDRFPSMMALLDELGAATSRRSGWIAGGLAGLALAGGAAFVLLAGGVEREDPCASGRATLASTWSDARATRLGDKLAASTAPAALEAWVGSWRDAHGELCTSAESSPMARARLRCLDGVIAELDALARAFEEADASVVDRAADAVARLGQPQACLRPDWRPAPRVSPPPPAAATAVATAEAGLVMAEAYQRAGASAQALAQAEAARDIAEAAAYPPLLAAAHYHIGRARMDEGRYDDAENALRRSFAAALAAGDDQRLFAAAGLLLYCVGFSRGDAEGGALWLTLSEAARERAGGGTEAEANYWDARGAFAVVRGDYDAARSAYTQALELRRELFPPEHPELAWSLSGLAAVDVELRAFADAERRSREVLTLRTRALGPEHPDLIVARTTLAAALTAQGKHDEAIAELERALAIGEAKLGADSPRLVGARSNLASALNRRGEHRRARALYAEVLAHFEATRDPDDPLVGLAHNNLGGTYYKLEEPATALAHHRRALEIWIARFGREHAKVALARNGVAADLLALERCAEARIEIAEARSILAAADPPSSLLAYVDNTRAKVSLCEGRATEAAEAAGEAVALGRATLGEGSRELVPMMLTRARTLLVTGDFVEARAAATEVAALAGEGASGERAEALVVAAKAARGAGDELGARALAVEAEAATPSGSPRSRALQADLDGFAAGDGAPPRLRN